MDGEKGLLKQDMTHKHPQTPIHFSLAVCVQIMKDAPEAECVLRGSVVSFLRNQPWDFRLVSHKTGEKSVQSHGN